MSIISKLKLSEFIDHLLAGGADYPDQEQWKELMIDYAAALESPTFEAYMDACVRMNVAASKFQLVESIVQVLEVDYNPEYVRELKEFGYMGQYNPETREAYLRDLQNAYKKAKSFLILAKQKKEEIDRIEKESEGSGEITREVFDENLISLSKFFGYHVKDTDITVLQYCLMIKRMRDAKNN